LATTPQIHQYRCPACGGELTFQPKDGALVCPFCKRTEAIPASKEQVVERSYEEYLKTRPEDLQKLSEKACQVTCEGCGAAVTFEPPDVAAQCPFCGAPIVNQPKSADALIAPQGLLPFALSLEQALDAVRQWIKSRWFLPDALKKAFRQESIFGVYLPFWTFGAASISYYIGMRGDYYYETETYTTTDQSGNQVTETRQIQHTAWSPAEGMVQRIFSDLLIPATTSLPAQRLEELQPWDLPALKPYEPAYLAGFKANRYQLDPGQGFEVAKEEMQGVIADDVRSDIGGNEQQIESVSTSYTAVTFKHLLLPVWLCVYRFQNRVFHLMVNGRTGEVIGERPHSAAKIAVLVLLLLLAAFIIFLLTQK
jgi:DNA-directed RNA polymerase subunit RPC12/RpoP